MAAAAHAFKKYQEMAEISVIRTLMSLNVFDAMSMNEFDSITLEELADRTAVNDSLLQRLLRIAVSTDIIAFDPATLTYAHTEISRGYCKGQSSADFFKLMHDEVLKTAVLLPEWIRHRGRLTDPTGPDSHTHNPLTYRDNKEGSTFFELMADDPERQSSFHKGMSSMAHLHPFSGVYDYSQLVSLASTTSAIAHNDEQKPLVVDIGGGNGTYLASLLSENPSLPASRMVLQDIPSVIEAARRDPSLPDGFQFQTHDFHLRQPVKNAHVYHIRACLHDYGDAQAVNILAQIAQAMTPDAKLLVEENIMSPVPQVSESIALADFCMMMCGGRERTEKDWADVLGQAGLKIDRISMAGGGLSWGVIEASLIS